MPKFFVACHALPILVAAIVALAPIKLKSAANNGVAPPKVGTSAMPRPTAAKPKATSSIINSPMIPKVYPEFKNRFVPNLPVSVLLPISIALLNFSAVPVSFISPNDIASVNAKPLRLAH